MKLSFFPLIFRFEKKVLKNPFFFSIESIDILIFLPIRYIFHCWLFFFLFWYPLFKRFTPNFHPNFKIVAIFCWISITFRSIPGNIVEHIKSTSMEWIEKMKLNKIRIDSNLICCYLNVKKSDVLIVNKYRSNIHVFCCNNLYIFAKQKWGSVHKLWAKRIMLFGQHVSKIIKIFNKLYKWINKFNSLKNGICFLFVNHIRFYCLQFIFFYNYIELILLFSTNIVFFFNLIY